jgi:hypothetical protein
VLIVYTSVIVDSNLLALIYMISATKQKWNRITILFLTTSIIQVIVDYGKILSFL